MVRCKYVPFFFIVHCFFLFSYDLSPGGDNNFYNTPYVAMQVNNSTMQSPRNWHISGHVSAVQNYSDKCLADYSIIAQQASPQLQEYFASIVSPLIYDAAIGNHYAAIPGYTYPDGLQHCIQQLSQFSCSDTALMPIVTKRLETYCTFIEGVLFSGENHSFCDTISYKDQVKLVKAYADFLKEFYAEAAPYIFYNQSQENSLMQQVMPFIEWGHYDGNNSKSSAKHIAQQYAASVNGNLGAVYRALHEGSIEKAYRIGHEQVQTVMPGKLYGKTETDTSVFERYPVLRQKVEQEYGAKQNFAQQGAAVVKAQSSEGVKLKALIPCSDVLQQRNDAATCQLKAPQFFEKLHNVFAEQAACIAVQHLTPDRKGILLDGGYLQHHIVDEAITVVDVVISNDLTNNMHDAVIDLANASLTLNKDGDVVMATRALDACWALIDYAHDAAHYTYSILSTHLPLVAKGACDGVCESLHGAVHKVCHPLEAAQDAAQSLAVAGYYVGKVAYAGCVYEAACDALESDPQCYEQIMEQYSIDPDALLAVYEQAHNISSEDVARVGTKTALDMMLLHGVTKAVSAIAKESWVEFIACMRKGEQSSDVALTAENISVRCGKEIASAMENMQKADVGVAAGAKRYGKQGSPYEKISKATQQQTRPLNSLEGKELIGIENVSVQGYGPLPKRISLANYKHYLQPELRTTSRGKIKPSGWHHDPGRRIENIKRINGYKINIEFYEKHKSGIYRFDWGVEGMRKKTSTFFPHSWSRETVQQKIVEAYKYARKHHYIPELQPTGNFSVKGFTKEKIKINIIIDQKGMVVTGYPVWPE